MNLRTAPTTSFAQQEHLRLTRHFVDAAATVQARDVSTLDPLRALLRTLLLQELDEYRDASEFPRNYSHADNTPVFVDPHGTHCAMGHLIAITGHHELVEHIAETQNFARIKEMTANEELLSWLNAVGLTAQDAAVIQPSYSTCASIETCLCASGPLRGIAPHTQTTALFDCTITGSNTNRSWIARVDAVYGQDTTTVGSNILLNAGVEASVGMRVLVPVGANHNQSTYSSVFQTHVSYTAQNPAGLVEGLGGFLVNAEGNVLCPIFHSTLSTPPVPAAVAMNALLATQCNSVIRLFSANVSTATCRPNGGCFCASPIGVTPPQASITMLLTLVSAIFARRARRSHRPR